MKTTFDTLEERREARWREERRRIDELASLSADMAAATARWIELAWSLYADGMCDDPIRFLAYRCGITNREAGEYFRVAEALQELPAIRAAFSRGELTYTKVRALTRVATPAAEAKLLDLAGILTATQLERALRVFRRLQVEEARETHELEFVDYRFEPDGSLSLRARLAAEDGLRVVKALEAAKDGIAERRRVQRAAAMDDPQALALALEASRSVRVEALVEIAEASLASVGEHDRERARVVVHVDAAALTHDGRGRSELEHGPVIAPETARRLGCDAEVVAQVERDGLPLSVGRTRRTVPPALRRLLEARDDETCCFPGCDRRRHLQAHHRRHWAHGGETSLDNLILLCWHHHRLVHEGGYTIEEDAAGGLGFRNRHGVLSPSLPPRPPPGSLGDLQSENRKRGIEIGAKTNRHGCGDPMQLGPVVDAIDRAFAA